MSATEETSPYEIIGGLEALRRITDRFYDLMEADPAYAELRALHQTDLAPMRTSLAEFLMGWTGGPRTWFEARPGACMMSMHAKIPVTAATARQWCEAMSRAIAETGVDPTLTARMNEAFSRISQGMRRDLPAG